MKPMIGSRRLKIRLAVAVVAALIAALGATDLFGGSGSSPTAPSDQVGSTDTGISTDPGDQITFSDLPPISVADLPPEALDTLTLIDSNGPFPFDRDGLVFQNREGLLPDHPRGHYHEYTVITPGEDDRGARRIVAGGDGELYYTDDHYQSFHEVVDW